MGNRSFGVVLIAVAVAVGTHGGARGSDSQSPGGVDRFLMTSDPCPTFSWSQAPGALEYELVVYRVQPPAEGGVVEVSPSLRLLFPAGSSSWTPTAHQCLRPGERYAWSVRAAYSDGRSRGWSEPRLLEIELAGSPELEAAIERTLERLGVRGAAPQPAPAIGNPSADGARRSSVAPQALAPAPVAPPAPTSRAPSPSMPLFTGPTGLFSEQTNATGVTFGVVGTTQSDDVSAAGVYGEQSAEGSSNGIFGVARSSLAIGVQGRNADAEGPCQAGPHGLGVYGVSEHVDGVGVLGEGLVGVRGTGGGALGTGVIGSGVTGVRGSADGSAGDSVGVRGTGSGAGSLGGFFDNSVGADLLGAGGSVANPLFKVDGTGKIFATGMDVGAFSPQTVSAGSATASVNSPLCPAGTVRTGGGCRCGPGNPIETSEPDGTGRWSCTCSSAGVVAYSVCLGSA